MKKIIFIIISLILIISVGCSKKETDKTEKLTVAVSIVPEATFVKAVAGELVNVVTMIPPGGDPHNFQPTPKQMTALSNSKLYFSIGVGTEKANILPKLKNFNKNIKLVKLDDIVSKFYPHRRFAENNQISEQHDNVDPHIWMSPKRVKVMVNIIKDELVKIDPLNKEIYTKNAENYLLKLDNIDNDIKNILSKTTTQSFIIFHPSLGYFADDYGLKMITIEENGKEATAKRIQQVIDYAKENNIKFIIYQEEMTDTQAKTIAHEIGGATVKVSPLSPDYINNLRNITSAFNEVLR